MLCTKIVVFCCFDFQNNICTQRVLYSYFSGKSMNNHSSHYGLTDSRMRASEKDLPVIKYLRGGIGMWIKVPVSKYERKHGFSRTIQLYRKQVLSIIFIQITGCTIYSSIFSDCRENVGKPSFLLNLTSLISAQLLITCR